MREVRQKCSSLQEIIHKTLLRSKSPAQDRRECFSNASAVTRPILMTKFNNSPSFYPPFFLKKYYLMSEISDYDLILTLVLFVLQGEFSPFEIYNCGICPWNPTDDQLKARLPKSRFSALHVREDKTHTSPPKVQKLSSQELHVQIHSPVTT